jgi:hypothetical protein
MFSLKKLKNDVLIMEYNHKGDKSVMWLFKKLSDSKGKLIVIEDYNGILRKGGETIAELDSKLIDDYKIIGNAEDYPEYLI